MLDPNKHSPLWCLLHLAWNSIVLLATTLPISLVMDLSFFLVRTFWLSYILAFFNALSLMLLTNLQIYLCRSCFHHYYWKIINSQRYYGSIVHWVANFSSYCIYDLSFSTGLINLSWIYLHAKRGTNNSLKNSTKSFQLNNILVYHLTFNDVLVITFLLLRINSMRLAYLAVDAGFHISVRWFCSRINICCRVFLPTEQWTVNKLLFSSSLHDYILKLLIAFLSFQIL